MQKIVILVLLSAFSARGMAQNTLNLVIKDERSKDPLPGVTIALKGAHNTVTTNDKGFVALQDIPAGKQTILIQSVGFKEKEKNIILPQADTLIVFMEHAAEELEEIKVVSSTRSSRNIKDIPTRIEGIPPADLDEKSAMQPGNIKMLVGEISGVLTQQTSQVSGSAGIRIQGLDGKYTQLLQDGFPLYSGLASGLSVLQIPPLNLKRVEIIKGSTSTLYGGGAIAGLIDLITKDPGEKRELSFLANINQAKGLDLSGFYAEKYKKTGLTLYTAGNFQDAYDPNKDGFSDIPKYRRFTFSPRFYYYPKAGTTLTIGLNAGTETRTGGDMTVINHSADAVHTFFETNNTDRYSSQLTFEKISSNRNVLTLKNSVGYFSRQIKRPAYTFDGNQVSTFSEANYLIPRERSEWNIGSNFNSESFKQLHANSGKLDYYTGVLGVFAQNNFKASPKFIIESGLRVDMTNRNDVFMLPRLSLLYKITDKLSSRIGGGLGYKNPTIFSEDAEERAFQNIIIPDFSALKAERSYGLNGDLNYKTVMFEDVNVSINQLFFYTLIKNPLILAPVSPGTNYTFMNVDGNIEAKGFETSLKLRQDDISCFIGYTYTDVTRKLNNITSPNPLTAKHHLDIDLMYEADEKLRIGYELTYTGTQYLSNNEKVRSYWVTGLLSEYQFGHFSVFLNFENFLDTRQSRWEPMYSGTMQTPQFREVYAPTDGIVANTGFKIRL